MPSAIDERIAADGPDSDGCGHPPEAHRPALNRVRIGRWECYLSCQCGRLVAFGNLRGRPRAPDPMNPLLPKHCVERENHEEYQNHLHECSYDFHLTIIERTSGSLFRIRGFRFHSPHFQFVIRLFWHWSIRRITFFVLVSRIPIVQARRRTRTILKTMKMNLEQRRP